MQTERGYVESRNIATPFFRPDVCDNEKQNQEQRDRNLFRKKKATRERFFDHIKKKDQGEISFGDVAENYNFMFFRNNKT